MVVCACTLPPEASTPENALRQFFDALSQGDKTQAWEMLSSETQAFLVHKTNLAFENSRGLLPNHPATLVFMTESTPPILEKIELAQTNGNADENIARLHVVCRHAVAGQKSALLTMKKEAGQWKLMLHHGVSDE